MENLSAMENSSHQSDHQKDQNKQWMSQLPEKLWDIPLNNLSIPGSHDTMSYCLDKNSPVDPKSPAMLCVLEKFAPCVARSIILKWSTTQVLNVCEQLNAGIRYLDLRIAPRPNDPSLTLNFVHGLFTSVTVEETLQEILQWLQSHPREVIILACKNLEEMTPVLHMHLISCIHQIFGTKLCPKKEQPTLRNMWNQGYQVIISYEDDLAMKYEFLWPTIPYWWANTTRTHSLIRYLEKHKEGGRPAGFFVAGLNLTENWSYILKHPFGSMKTLTIPKLPLLNKWVQKQHPGPQRDAVNIIAEDLIGSDNFVSAVINLNRILTDHQP
ncbi:PI-PLC X domain-containing protein 1 [Bombina bombina]|uniref:PI-PLC X domain-containing protein 1 n=1 Tax=Bombina bombina TaxID=8345 RepID=UPI00235AA0D7|nr:PI-PLC X domain-containing protein 1 [Bombina bombina]XP_053563720.1 PI-PLC X domain-containing protein 1 [Bombina bombina]